MDLHPVLSRPPKIVIADDDWLNRDLLLSYLTAAGCEVQAFEEGASALKAIQESLPDLALLDNHMPEMTGLEVCRTIKGDQRTQFIPVVIVTAMDSEKDELRAIEAGAEDAVVSRHWMEGGKGSVALGEAVVKACEKPSDFKFLYPLKGTTIKEKIETICKEIYGADGVEYSEEAEK